MQATSRRALQISVVTAFVCAALPAGAFGRTISVSPTGSDGADGTPSAPLKTISRAAAVARPGDAVLVGSGRYREEVGLSRAQSGVVFRGVGATRPVVDGEGSRAFGFKNTSANDLTIE